MNALFISEFQFTGTWDDFFEHVKAGKLLYGDHYEWVQDWRAKSDTENVLFVKYEDMKEDVMPQIKRIAEFLGLPVSESLRSKITDDVNFRQMKISATPIHTKWAGEFVRKGQSGTWRNYFTVKQNEWFDAKYKQLYDSLPFVHYE